MNEITLYKKAKTGATLQWSIAVQSEDDRGLIIRKSGQVGGKITTTNKYIDKGTNIGKKNEKTPFELAVTKAAKFVKDQVEDNWHYSIDDINKPIEFIKPMLAETLDIKKITFPCYAQPKMNGVRCFSLRHLGDETMWSRQRNAYTAIKEIMDAVGKYFGDLSPDGEAYSPDLTFQEIVSAVKKRKENTKLLKLWVYDLAIPDVSFATRLAFINSIFNTHADNGINEWFHQVPTTIIHSFEELDALHDQYVLLGYEGLIVRTADGVYEFNERSWDLMKYKKFFDREFDIIGYTVEVWNDTKNNCFRNLVMWKCVTDDGQPFDVRPAGSFLLREKALKTADKQIGQPYTVKYQNYSDDGIPIFPIGQVIRDYE